MPWLVTTGAAVLYAPLFVIGFLWLSLAVGRRGLIWLGVPRGEDVPEYALGALALGAGALSFVPFFLGAAGFLTATSVCVACAVIALASFSDVRAVARRARTIALTARRPGDWLGYWPFALAPAVLSAAILALSPTLDADGLGYHLTVPKRWLAFGSLEYLPTYSYSNTPMGVEMLFMLAMAFAGDTAAKLLHWALGIAGGAGVYLAGRRLGNSAVGAVATGLYFVGPLGVAPLLGWAYLEGAIAFATVAATLAWIVWFQRGGAGWLRLTAVLAGSAVSFKLTAALVPLALGALTACALFSRAPRERRFSEVLSVWRLLPFLAAPVLPWLIRSAIVTGNPVFPLFARVIPSRDFSPEIAARLEFNNRYMFWASNFGAGWTLERRQMILAGVALLLVIAGALLFLRLSSWMQRASLLVLLVVALAQISVVGLYARYWMPVLAILQLPVLALLEPALRARALKVLGVAALALVSVVQARRIFGTVRGDVRGVAGTAFGLHDKREFVTQHLPLYPLYEYVNKELPQNAHVMLSFFCAGFYVDRRTFCPDINQNSLRLWTREAFLADVRRLKITHVLAPQDWLVHAAGASVPGYAERERVVGEFLTKHGRLLTSAYENGLYALDTRAFQ
jgi:hypothetical protein